ncbi:Sulfotransferase [Hyella patelloides LEGE 07179]|uniref:Sulfotransferase n=1 Tax=Hyella patelloides LEGE 07179 TaxID=945734 RepID=A0A563VPX9_9CYAN|nr:tetratricopeptide repeat protein [Hyella patelloides]VEP13522.1 Sulfotransferase [Hyella patelloides LEGE 07179]
MKDYKSDDDLELPRNLPKNEITDYVALGKELQKQNKLHKAKKSYRQAITNNPHLWEAYQCLAELLTSEGKQEAVLAVYRQGIRENPQDTRYIFALAKALSNQKKWHYANLRYQEALKLKADEPWGYLDWAKVLVELQQWQQAQNATIKALQLKSDLWDAYHHLGKIFQHQHQWQSALKAYKKVVQLHPQFMHAYMRLAEVYRHLEQYQLAIDCYDYVIYHGIEKSPVQEQAIACYAATLKEHPHPTSQQYYELGTIYRAKSYFPQAISAYQKAIKLDPQFQLPYISIQYTPIGEKQLKQVVSFYRQLVAKNHNIPLAWGNLGDALSQQNKIAEAINCYRTSCYQRVTNLYPELANLDWQKPKQNAPDFIIAGASKCGTSSLYNYLSYHPQILLSHKKELDFFGHNFNKGIAWYLAHFPTICDRNNLLTGEATPNYLRFPQIATRIKATCPNTKLIILLRNPVDRAISWHYHKINTGLTTGSLEDAISQEIKQLENLDETELMQGGYRKIDNIFSSFYYYQLKAWMEHLPREQFLILKSEDFYSNTAMTMKAIFNFLGVNFQELEEYSKVNVGFYKQVDSAVRETLKQYFKPYNRQLEEFLELEFNW